MPADRLVELPLGSQGLDLRSSVTELEPGDLSDTLNWQIDRTGALLKRRGFSAWAVQAPGDILTLMALQTSGETIYIVAHCDDGGVYQTIDGTSWGTVDTGISATTPVGWVQYLDALYYCDGTNAMRSWDGTTLTTLATTDQNDVQTVTITGTPTGGVFKLSYGGFSTVDIAYNAAATDVQTALQGLTSVGSGNVHCTGGALPGTGVVCTFVGALAARAITPMTSTNDAFTGGTAPASHVAHTTTGFASIPTGVLLTIWRNRLYVSGVSGTPRRVYWSAANSPADFSVKTNYVDFPADSEITAIHVGPNTGLGSAGADGVIVFTKNRVHRIYDDSDNNSLAGPNTGGANLLVDEQAGAVGANVIAPTTEGNLWFLSETGFHSTDGHAVSDESTRVQPLLRTFGWGLSEQFCSFSLGGRYYLAFTPIGQGSNTRLLEAYADLFRIGWIRRRGGQHQWMAHDVPIASAVVVNTSAGQVCYFADASAGDGGFVRKLFDGGSDADNDTDQVPITATARTGAQLFGVTTAKRLRRAELYGYGNISFGVSADLEAAVGETLPFDMRTVTRVWSLADSWGVGVWGGGGGAKRKAGYYTTRGRYLTFTISETSMDPGVSDRVLGYAGAATGGAAVYSAILKITPLDSD